MSRRFLKEKAYPRLAVALAVAGGLSVLAAPAASAAPIKDEGGPAKVVKPVTSGTQTGDFLSSGTAATLWTLALPPQAKCSADTATSSFHTYTYVVPAAVDPAGLHFGSNGPDNNPNSYPLVDDGGSPIIAINTAPTTGQVLPVPYFTLQWGNPPTPFDATLIPPGTYNIGIACATAQGAVDKFWNVQEVFTGDPTVFSGANAFAWTVVPASDVPEVPVALLLPLSAIGLFGAGFVVRRRRRSRVPVATA